MIKFLKVFIPFTLLIVFAATSVIAKTVYVSPTGSDSNTGTFASPYLTIPKAYANVVAGDTINLRGGTYTLTTTISISKSGTSAKKYYLLAYGTERPILDFSSMSESSGNRGINLSGSYWYVKGIDIKGAGDNGMNMSGSYNTVEYCAFYLNRDSGLQLGGGAAYNNILNCDSYFNKDAGEGNADGFAVKLDVGTGNYYYGCRSWQNSDDGWDGYLRPSDDINTTLENCWCFMNGYRADGTASTGNGNGFKLGGSDAKDLRHNFTLKKCISFDNRVKGFDQNNNKGSMTLYNCTGYRNGTNYSFVSALDTGKTLTLINCVVLGSVGNISIASTQQTNSWMSPFSVSTADFQNVDTAGMRGPRNADGSLPNTSFMHLATGSDLIDAGTNVGLAYNGTAPDLGFYESGASSSLPALTTTAISSVTQTTASSGGTISSDGGTSITARGVCWNTSGSPTRSNSYTADGTGTGTFTSSLTGLAAGTTYYVRAYAINGSGTSYGSQLSFTTSAAVVPTITTSSVSSITQTTASCGGAITSNGGAAVTAYGVCWNTTGSPTISNSHTTDGSGTTSFTSTLNGLTLGTTYYVAAYATNSAGTAYGSTVTFTTLTVSIPTVTTSTTSSITMTSASNGGTVTSDGGASVTARGVCWNTSGTPSITDSHTTDGAGTGSFVSALTSLTLGTTYHVRAYATNSIGTAYGADSSFQTLSNAQTDSVKWALTVNQSAASGAHVTGSTQVLSGGGGILSMSVKDYAAGGTNGGERLNLGSTSWPTETAQNDGRYAEFSLTPATGYDFTVNGITFDAGYSGTTGHMFSNIYYSLDGWTTRTKVNTDSIVLANSAWNSPSPSYSISIPVVNGKTLALRIYPWYNTSPSTTKYLGLRNFVVKGTSGASNSGNTPTAPTVSLTSITNISQSSISLQSSVSDSGSAAVTARGVCYSTSASPAVSGSHTSDGTGIGSFTSQISGLSAGTTYHIRPYAVNSVGTSYGTDTAVITLTTTPTVITSTISGVTSSSAVCGGTVSDSGGAIVSARGVCWSVSANPTLTNSFTSDGSGAGTFTSSISGLSAGTAYHIRAYATNSAGTAYGADSTFTTSTVLPTVTTNGISAVTAFTAAGGGNVISSGGATVTARGVCWSTASNPTISNSHTTDSSGIGAFASSITGLTAGTVYHVRAYATNSTGTAYGGDSTFSTLAVAPSVTTNGISSITANGAIGGGTVTGTGGAAVTARGVCWSVNSNPTISNSHTSDSSGTGSFTSILSGLSSATTYHVRAYAVNSAGTGYGADSAFTTLANVPTVTTNGISNITSSSATCGGNVSNAGGATVTARGVCWSTTGNPTISGSHTTDSSGTGSFVSTLTGLSASTTYHVRAYATNNSGTSYGGDSSFQTLASGGLVFENSPIGFASVNAFGQNGTTGGAGGDTIIFTSRASLQAFMNARAKANTLTPTVCLISGTITNDTTISQIYVKRVANLSIIGKGSNALLDGLGLAIVGSKNIIVRNIEMRNAKPDCVTINTTGSDTCHHVWIDHCTFSDDPEVDLSSSGTHDGLVDITHRTSYVTVSWCEFHNHDKVSLLGYTDNATDEIGFLYTTYHHNWWNNTVQRHPRVRHTMCHVLNNYYDGTNPAAIGLATIDGYGVASTCEADVYVEGNYFVNVYAPTHIGEGNSPAGDLLDVNNIAVNSGSILSRNTHATPFAPLAYYSYTADQAANVPAIIKAGAGAGKLNTGSNSTIPTVTTNSASSISQTSATSGGVVTTDGGATVTSRGVCWNTTGTPTVSDSHTSDNSGTGAFTSTLNGLTPGAMYYVRAYAANSLGTAYGNAVTFSTLTSNLPSVTTAGVTSRTKTSATSGGVVTSDAGSTVTARGVCWNTSGSPTIADSHTSDGTGTGSFTSSLSSLTSGTTYHVRAYAINANGTAYGGDSTFQTLSDAQSDSVLWALTANQTSTSGTHVTGSSQVLSSGGGVLSMSVKDYSAGGTTGGGQRLNLGSTSWPSETAQNDGRYTEFDVTPASGYNFTATGISFNVGYSATTSHMFSNVYYSLDNWASRTKVNTDSIVSANSAWNSPAPSYAINITVSDGSTLSFRIYPWYNSTASTTKYLCLKNFVVKGTSAVSAAMSSGTVALNVIPQGYYNSGGFLNTTDTIGVYLAQQSSPYTYIDSTKAVLDSAVFSASAVFSNAASGNYYLVVKHRNCVETWSAATIAFAKGASVSYDFTTAQSKAYGNNLVQVSASPVRWAMYSGDVNQDGYVDPLDLSLVDQASFNYSSGQALSTDINGDGYVDPLDLSIVDQNSYSYVGVQKPLTGKTKHLRIRTGK